MRNTLQAIGMIIIAVLLMMGCEDKKYVVSPEEPAVPLGVYSVTGDGWVDIYWQANNDGGATEGYGVYRYSRTVGGSDEYELIGTVNASPLVEEYSFRDDDLTNGVTYYYAVNAFNDFGESDLSDPDAMDTPRPQGNASIDLTGEDDMRLGWDFSQVRTRNWQSVDSDVFFEYDANLDAFFIWSNRDDVYIQSFGATSSLQDINWGEPGSGWNNVGWMELTVGHAYLVAIGDVDQDEISENYAAVRITALNFNTQEISFQWAYQTDPFNPELKRSPFAMNNSATNTSGRSGN